MVSDPWVKAEWVHSSWHALTSPSRKDSHQPSPGPGDGQRAGGPDTPARSCLRWGVVLENPYLVQCTQIPGPLGKWGQSSLRG